MTGPRRFTRTLRFRRSGASGPWRIAVVEASMRPAVEPGDWLLVDPTVARWPRRGTIVVFREPGSDDLAIKRVAARPGDWVPFADAWLQLAADEAWLIGDATDDDLAAGGFGPAVDSRRYGPVPLDALVARAWFRYWPSGRIGRIADGPPDLLERGRAGSIPTAREGEGPEVPESTSHPADGANQAGPDTVA